VQYCSSSGACVSKIAQTPSLREQIVRCKSLDLGGDSSLVLVPTWSPMSFAKPKSGILASPRLVMKMFAGLMSRWMIPFS
jgi:hypothetical protein